MPKTTYDITIAIFTYNGEKYIGDILKALKKQKIDKKFEVLIIDSGSTDDTLAIIVKHQKALPSMRLHEISNSDYGHGKTRQLAAEMAEGAIVVYLSHDAVPAHIHWLYEMVKVFDISPNIVGVTGRQIPRPGCFPLLKYEILHVFNNFGPAFGTTIFYKDSFIRSQEVYNAVCFYSDANSAARKSVLIGDIPYQDVAYAEDQLFGRDVIDAGLMKAYTARGSVIHSNDLRLGEYKNRMFDEVMGLRRVGIKQDKLKHRTALKLIIKGVIGDTIRIIRDKDYTNKRKLYWIVINPFFHIEKWRGVRKATHIRLSDKVGSEKYSLEHSKKQ